MSASTPQVDLGGGVAIPQLGFGVFQIPADRTQAAVEAALEAGYRHIDTAAAYTNEAAVGAAIRASGITREELFVTTKLRNGDQGRGSARRAFEASRAALGLDVVDLYLVHWPSPARDLYRESWTDLEDVLGEGGVRAIGVSNFLIPHLERLLASARVVPAVDQLEIHPTFQQREVVAFCRREGIAVEAYSPLGQGADLESPVVTGIAATHGATPAQVVLARHLALGHIVIPKTERPERMRENLGALELALTPDEVDRMSGLDAGNRIGGDPDTFEISQIR